MKRFIIATLAALSAFGCGDQPEPAEVGQFDPSLIGGRWANSSNVTGCSEAGQDELARFGAAPGYASDGCTRSERMADVRPFTADFGLAEPGEYEPATELGQLEQPITVANGPGAAVSLTVQFRNGRLSDAKTNGRCKPKVGWTVAEPIQDNCLVPFKVGSVDWSVSPDLYSTGDRNYMRDRMRNAWAVWSRTLTCSGTSGTFQRTTALKPASGSETTGGATNQDNYALSEIPVYPVVDAFNVGGFAARTEMDLDVIESFSGAPNGVKYFGWKYSGIAVQHNVVEGTLWPNCVDVPRDANAMAKLANAYNRILAHELGHVWGQGHGSRGIMRPGNQQSCSEVFSASASSALDAPTASERLGVNILRDSNGINTIPPESLGTSINSCSLSGDGTTLTGVIPDMFFGQFF
jgi:hypothetical protein